MPRTRPSAPDSDGIGFRSAMELVRTSFSAKASNCARLPVCTRKWRLMVFLPVLIVVTSLLQSPTGTLANLSALPPRADKTSWPHTRRLFRPAASGS